MRRTGSIPLLLAALAIPLGALSPASAHVTFNITGFQYVYTDGFEVGLAGYVNTPAGPQSTGSVPENDVIEAISNHDGLAHTFTQCVAYCDTNSPTFGTAFDIGVEPGQTKAYTGPGSGTIVFGCKIYQWMRGTITLTGE